MPKVLRLEWTLPDEAFGEGFDEGSFLTQVQEEVVMRLLKEQRISQGKAAELLGVNRYALVDLMGRYDIPATELSPEDMTREFARADALFRGKGA